MNLKTLVKITMGKRGMEYLIYIDILRNYIMVRTDDELIREIYTLDDFEQLRILLAAGMRKRLLEAVLKRYDELVKGVR